MKCPDFRARSGPQGDLWLFYACFTKFRSIPRIKLTSGLFPENAITFPFPLRAINEDLNSRKRATMASRRAQDFRAGSSACVFLPHDNDN